MLQGAKGLDQEGLIRFRQAVEQHISEFIQALLKYFPLKTTKYFAQILCMSRNVTIKFFLICIIS